MKRDKKIQKKDKFDIGGLIIKQIIATAICFAFVLGMQNCGHPVISDYADSLGHALRYNADWENAANSVTNWVKEQFNTSDTPSSEEYNTNQSLPTSAQEIIFQ
ncbi:MAG: hypothetical protein IJA16_01380 [Clostridia bacterium]|nr:hypothetical protein [Clostridia bacterium]